MDPTTTVVLITLNLGMNATLIFILARHNSTLQPLMQGAACCGLFAGAFVVRLAFGLGAASPWAPLPDTMMVFAIALFVRGQRQFLSLPAVPLRRLVAAAMAFGAVHALVTTLGGQQVRHVLLNTALALLYLEMARLAWVGHGLVTALERPVQRLMLSASLVLGISTALRALDALIRGVEPLFSGPTAQLYYAVTSFCTLLLGPAVLWWIFARLSAELHRLATHDALTGVLNRNGLEQSVRRHFGMRERRPLVWLMLDLDHFKRVNDTLGHYSGDKLLQAVAKTLETLVRGEDLVARLGGEEFLVGVAGPDPGQAEALAERLRAGVEALPFAGLDGKPWPCTVSIGVSPPFNADGWEAALRSADDALYAAKAAGRNRVVVGGATP